MVPPIPWLTPSVDWLAAMRPITCSAVVTPARMSSSARMMVTGSELSASMRLIEEPVISTR